MNALYVVVSLILLCSISTVLGIPYQVYVHTGDVFGAGTDARVFMTIFGENGQSPEFELNSNRNDFERDHTDLFEVEVPRLGRLKKIRIRHDNTWFGAGWFLDKVEIKDEKGCVYEFPSHRWLASNVDDGKISRDFITKTTCKPRAKDFRNPTACKQDLGVSNGLITDAQMTASSSYDNRHQPFHARLNQVPVGSRGGWCSAFADDTEFLQVDFGNSTYVQGIATQGQALFDNWVTRYTISYTTDGSTWKPVRDKGTILDLSGNSDRNTVVTHWFPGVTATAIRVRPLAWNGLTNCLRMELYGCKKGDVETASKKGEPWGSTSSALREDQESQSIIKKSVLYLRFEKIVKRDIIRDRSDLHNDARIVNFARLVRFSEKCGKGVDLNGGDVLLDGERFVNKPRTQVTIAAWVKLNTVDTPNSIFDTIGGVNSTHEDGQYHYEVDGGAVRWFHRNAKGRIIFNVTTEVIVPANVWTHVAGVYDSKTKFAEVYVNAKFVMREEGAGLLSQDWTRKAGIGQHKGERLLKGMVDEFYISNQALTQEEIKKLMKRCKFEKECFTPIGMEDMRIKDEQITASSTLQPHKPYYSRLNLISFYDDPKRSAWCADDDDKEPYLTIDLRDEKTVSGVAIQGASVLDCFVTSFKLCHSQTGRKYDCVSENGTGEAFVGNIDKDSVKIHWLTKFFDARFVRFYPLAWYGESICMRIELYGCITGLLSDTTEETAETAIIDPTQSQFADCSSSCGRGTVKTLVPCNRDPSHPGCTGGNQNFVQRKPCERPSCPECFYPMGMANGKIPDKAISASSGVDHTHAPFFGRLITEEQGTRGHKGSWCTTKDDGQRFLQVDLQHPVKLTGIGTQGQVSTDQWVTKYRIEYSINNIGWNNYTENSQLKVFSGNDDKDTISIRHLRHPVMARFIRIYPLTWHGRLICMRSEIYGCDNEAMSASHSKASKLSEKNSHSFLLPKKVLMKLQNEATVQTQMGLVPSSSSLKPIPLYSNIAQGNPSLMTLQNSKAEQFFLGAKNRAYYSPQSGQFYSNVGNPETAFMLNSGVAEGRMRAPIYGHMDATSFTNRPGASRVPFYKTMDQQRVLQQSREKNTEGMSRFHVLDYYRNNTKGINSQSKSKSKAVQKAKGHGKLKKSSKQGTRRINKLGDPVNRTSKHNIMVQQMARGNTNNNKAHVELEGYHWSKFSSCSVTCGRGVKERYRKCNAIECTVDGIETEMVPCFTPPCKASTEWSGYSKCSVTCGVGKRTRSRQCNGRDCPKTGREIATIPCHQPECPVLNLDFEEIENHVLVDQSGKGNNAYMGFDSRILSYNGVCGHYAELGQFGNILLEDLTFRRKPREGVSIAGWVNIRDSTRGSHSIFSTARAINVGQIIGGYHFEIDDGKIRWFHRTREHNPVFSIMTDDVIRPNVWFHVTATYQARAGNAKVYVDGELKARGPGNGLLDTDWGYKASVGSFDFDGRFIRAKLDDFYMFDYEISPKQVQDLLRIKCPKKGRR